MFVFYFIILYNIFFSSFCSFSFQVILLLCQEVGPAEATVHGAQQQARHGGAGQGGAGRSRANTDFSAQFSKDQSEEVVTGGGR